MSWGDDVYCNPEKFGLTTVASMEWDAEAWQFNMTVAWMDDKTGKLYWASDSGCSCPSPFEDFTEISQLETGTMFDLFAELDNTLAEWRNAEFPAGQVAQFKEEVLRKCR